MFTKTATIFSDPEGTCISDPNGISIGYTKLPTGEECRFIMSRKNGVPVGPEYAWRLNGERYYINHWDNQGKLLGCRQWLDGKEVIIDETCSICLDDIEKYEDLDMTRDINLDSVHLSCRHMYHFQCINDWFKIHNTCPQCQAVPKKNSILFSPLYLCTVVGRDPCKFAFLVRDIFGTEIWIRESRLCNILPGSKTTPASSCDKRILTPTVVYYDHKYHYMVVSDGVKVAYIANIEVPVSEINKKIYPNRINWITPRSSLDIAIDFIRRKISETPSLVLFCIDPTYWEFPIQSPRRAKDLRRSAKPRDR